MSKSVEASYARHSAEIAEFVERMKKEAKRIADEAFFAFRDPRGRLLENGYLKTKTNLNNTNATLEQNKLFGPMVANYLRQMGARSMSVHASSVWTDSTQTESRLSVEIIIDNIPESWTEEDEKKMEKKDKRRQHR